jgi:pyruvate dehydrogenase E2 component (dihydrolipoamide acetyltransferase)
MPKLSDTMTEGTVVKWLKKVGDKIESGELIAEVETDKATMEMESWEEGVVTELAVPEGGKVPVGGKIAFVKVEGEEAPAAGAPAAKTESAKVETAQPKAEAPKAAPASAAAEPAGDAKGLKASPLARKLATEAGLDLRKLKGTGPAGRIIKRDIEEALASAGEPAAEEKPAAPAPAAAPAAPAAPAPIAATAAGSKDKTIPLTNMRRIIAERLLASKTTIPHFYLTISVDAGPLMAFRTELNEKSTKTGGPKFTVNDFVVKAIVSAAAKVSEINASFAGDSIIQYGDVNVSVAISVEDGLVTPVIKAAQSRTLSDISLAVKDLATRARDKKLKPDEFAGGTITVSNLGSYGVDFFDAIINPPQAAIVSVGAVTKEPVVNEKDEIVVGQRMFLGLSCDHRVVDGAVGAKFMQEIKRLLETPYLILV